MKNSEIRINTNRRVRRARLAGDIDKSWWYAEDIIRRFHERKTELANRRNELRTANRRWRRQNGLTLRYS